MSIKQSLDKWIAEFESDGMCDISDQQVIALIRGYSALEAKCAALAAELKQSQIDAGCYKHGMEASNARLAQVAAENAGLLAGMEQEPVAVMTKGGEAFISKELAGEEAFQWCCRNDIPLYAAPQLPQPAVTECYQRLLHHAYGMTMGHDWNKGTMAGHHREKLCKAVEDCRAAMLQGAEPVSQPYRLRDGWVAVPVEATLDMVKAGAKAASDGFLIPGVYRSMLAAAPQQETK